jgi:hypothetical protein
MLLETLLQLGAPHDPDLRGSSDLLVDASAVPFSYVVIREHYDASRLVSKEDLQSFRSDEFGRDRLATAFRQPDRFPNRRKVRIAVDYYADYPAEVDAWLAKVDAQAVEAEELSRRRRQGNLADFFAASPLRESGLEIERPEDFPQAR